MRVRKALLVLAAAALPLASVSLLEGTAFAGKVTGAGLTSCGFSGTISFNPPLTSAGSTSIKKEVTTVTASLSHCTGGTPPGPATVAQIKPIKSKTTKGTAGGTCSSFEKNASTIVVKVKINWAGEKPSKFNITKLSEGANSKGEVGFTGSFPVTGSYAGTGNVKAYLTTASTSKILSCSGSVSSLQLDPSSSSGKL